MYMTLSTFTISFAVSMSDKEIIELREESKDMFYHAYNAYLFNAFPADELMPLSCQGNLSFMLLVYPLPSLYIFVVIFAIFI